MAVGAATHVLAVAVLGLEEGGARAEKLLVLDDADALEEQGDVRPDGEGLIDRHQLQHDGKGHLLTYFESLKLRDFSVVIKV